MTQNEMILQHMEKHGGITPREALDLYGCMRLGARIYDLKQCGYSIIKTMETGTNRNGEKVCFAKYTLLMQNSMEAAE